MLVFFFVFLFVLFTAGIPPFSPSFMIGNGNFTTLHLSTVYKVFFFVFSFVFKIFLFASQTITFIKVQLLDSNYSIFMQNKFGFSPDKKNIFFFVNFYQIPSGGQTYFVTAGLHPHITFKPVVDKVNVTLFMPNLCNAFVLL